MIAQSRASLDLFRKLINERRTGAKQTSNLFGSASFYPPSRDKRVQPSLGSLGFLNVDANNARVEKVQHATPISSKQCSSCPRATNIISWCFFSARRRRRRRNFAARSVLSRVGLFAQQKQIARTRARREPRAVGRRENKLERTNLRDAGRGGACKIRVYNVHLTCEHRKRNKLDTGRN
jgi:hypothetical protein